MINHYKLPGIILVFLVSVLAGKQTGAQLNDGSPTIKMAGYQMNVSNDIHNNKKKILTGMRNAASEGADFLITPEGSLSGYTKEFDQEQLQIALAPGGQFMGAYSKILRCSSLDFPGTGEMLDYVEGELKTFAWKGHRFGILICNDLWATPGYTTMPNPYLPWKLKQMGVQFIIHCINSGTGQKYRPFHESSAELWALSVKIPILEVNASYNEQPINAQSGFIDANGERILTVPYTGEHMFIMVVAGADR